MKSELYSQLFEAAGYFRIQIALEERFEEIKSNIKQLKQAFEDEKYQAGASSRRLDGLGFLILIPSVLYLGYILLVAVIEKSMPRADQWTPILVSCIATAVGFVMTSISKKKHKKVERYYDELYNGTLLPKLNELENTLIQIADYSNEVEDNNASLLEVVPFTYRNFTAISYMLIAVENGRADNLKDAINLYEEQLHRWKLEDAAHQSKQAQEYIALALEELNQRQAETNLHLQVLEFLHLIQ